MEVKKVFAITAKELSNAADRGKTEVATIGEFLESDQLSMITGCSV